MKRIKENNNTAWKNVYWSKLTFPSKTLCILLRKSKS